MTLEGPGAAGILRTLVAAALFSDGVMFSCDNDLRC